MNKKLLSTTLILAICAVFFSCSKSQSITLEYKLDSDAKTLLGEQNIKCKKRRIKINSAQISENEKSALEILLQYYTQKIDAEIENLVKANNADFKTAVISILEKPFLFQKAAKSLFQKILSTSALNTSRKIQMQRQKANSKALWSIRMLIRETRERNFWKTSEFRKSLKQPCKNKFTTFPKYAAYLSFLENLHIEK